MSALRWWTPTATLVCAVGHGAWLELEEPGHAALPVACALGGVAVEVPQLQFLDDGMVEYCWAWCLVRQWTHGLRQLLGAFRWLLHIFYVMVFSDPEVDAAPSMLQLLPQLVTLGNWTPRPRASRTWQFLVRCLGVLFMAQCLVQQWVHAMRQLLVLLESFLCEGELES